LTKTEITLPLYYCYSELQTGHFNNLYNKHHPSLIINKLNYHLKTLITGVQSYHKLAAYPVL